MNLLLKKELIINCKDEELLREFFDDFSFLDKIKKLMSYQERIKNILMKLWIF